jgi:hypothetical protein
LFDNHPRQFLSKDLSRNDGEQSAYQYCLGNPVLNIDPTGLWSWSGAFHWFQRNVNLFSKENRVYKRIYNDAYNGGTFSKVTKMLNPVYSVMENGSNTYSAIKRGDVGGAIFGTAMLALDFTTGGKGSLLKNGIKEGAEFALERGAREVAEQAGRATERTVMHHTVPREILDVSKGYLPASVANDPLVRGMRGEPNRWRIAESLHLEIHQGAGGGVYNQAWKDALAGIDGEITVQDVRTIRDRITSDFGIFRQ